MLRNLILLTIVFFTSEQLFAQENFSIEGYVINKTNHFSIAGAQIFLNGSTIGTLSNEEGQFTLSGIPSGTHELIIQNLGFESASKIISTDKLDSSYTFILVEKVYELNEITVKPNSQNWKYNFQEFRKFFIGQGPFSESTKIKSKEIINFDFDVEKRNLQAFAYDRIQIENKDLGYTIYFYLEDFEIDYKSGTTYFYGQTFFEEMTSKRRKTLLKWKENREKAYLGSFVHFTNSLIEKNSAENGFVIKAEVRKNDKRYLSSEEVSQNLFFQKIDTSYYQFKFSNFLNVTYMNEYEDITYLHSIASSLDTNPRMLVDYQQSSVTLFSDSVLVDKSGFIIDPTVLFFDGYWGFEKLSDMLPLTYKFSRSTKK